MSFDLSTVSIIVCVVFAAAAVEAFVSYGRAFGRLRVARQDIMPAVVCQKFTDVDDQSPYGRGTSLQR